MDDELTLEGCRRILEALRQENEWLRRSSLAFGDLAERLNALLHGGRRLRPDRRQSLRGTADLGRPPGD